VEFLNEISTAMRDVKRVAKDREFVAAAVELGPDVLREASKQIKNNESIVRHAVSFYPSALQYASVRLRDDVDIVLQAMVKARRGGADVEGVKAILGMASDRLQRDREFEPGIVLEAVEADPWFLEIANSEARANKGIVLSAVTSKNVLGVANGKIQDSLVYYPETQKNHP
jgi:hypothetical protein